MEIVHTNRIEGISFSYSMILVYLSLGWTQHWDEQPRGIVSNAVSDVPTSFSSSTLKSSSSDADGSLVASKVTSSDTDIPSSLSLPLLGLGADITLNKPTCLFPIVKSGLDQTSKCSRPAIVCLIQSAAAVGFQNCIMCTVIWLVVYTEVFMILLNHRTWVLIRYF